MSDNTITPARASKASLILPCAALALTVAAMAVGAPARLARLAHGPAALAASLELDPSIRYEPVVFADPAGARLVAAHRILDGLIGEQLVAFK